MPLHGAWLADQCLVLAIDEHGQLIATNLDDKGMLLVHVDEATNGRHTLLRDDIASVRHRDEVKRLLLPTSHENRAVLAFLLEDERARFGFAGQRSELRTCDMPQLALLLSRLDLECDGAIFGVRDIRLRLTACILANHLARLCSSNSKTPLLQKNVTLFHVASYRLLVVSTHLDVGDSEVFNLFSLFLVLQ